MTEKSDPRDFTTRAWFDRIRSMPSLPVIVVIAALVLTYGYEVFSFNLTVDEDATSTAGPFERAGWSIAEGRWAMALLTLLVPNPVAPVVSNGIGIALSGVAWWLIARRLLKMPPWHAAFAAAVAGTVPVMAFIFSFSTIAFAIGIGNMLLVAFFIGLSSRSWWLRSAAVVAAMTAIAVYDTFLVAIAAMALALIVRRPNFMTVGLAVGGSVLGLVASRLVGLVVSLATNVPQSGYTSGFFDVAGLVATPRARVASAIHDFWGVLSLSTERFALSSPWLAVSSILILVAAVLGLVLVKTPLKERLIRTAAVVALVALPFCVEAVASVVLLRSMFYLPIVLIALTSVASAGVRRFPTRSRAFAKCIIAAAMALAIVGNAAIANRSFSIAATTYSLDADLAFEIGQQKDVLLHGDNNVDLPVVVSGEHSWPEGAFTATRETLGLSLFNLNSSRTTKFLRAQGVLVHEASRAQATRVRDAIRTMPAYPEPGWIAIDHGVLILNFEQDE